MDRGWLTDFSLGGETEARSTSVEEGDLLLTSTSLNRMRCSERPTEAKQKCLRELSTWSGEMVSVRYGYYDTRLPFDSVKSSSDPRSLSYSPLKIVPESCKKGVGVSRPCNTSILRKNLNMTTYYQSIVRTTCDQNGFDSRSKIKCDIGDFLVIFVFISSSERVYLSVTWA